MTQGEVEQLRQQVAALTAQVRALEADAERTERTLRLAEAGVFRWDVERRLFIWSDGCYVLHDFDVGTPLTYPRFLRQVPEDFRDELESLVFAARDDHTVYDSTYPFRWRDGSVHWIHARGEWEYDAQGQATALVGVALTADDRHAVQEELARSEALLRDAQTAGGIGIWAFDSRTGRASLSDEFCRIHGIATTDMDAQDYIALLPPDELPVAVERFMAAAEKRSEFDSEHRIIHAQSGEIRWVHDRGVGEYDEDGNVLRFLGTTQDITVRKTAELASQESAEVWRSLTQAAPAIVCRTDAAGTLMFMNDARWEEFTGRAPGTWAGNGWLEAIHPDDRVAVMARVHQIAEQGGEFSVEARLQHLNGSVRWLLVHALPIANEHNINGYVGIGTDITALKASEQQRAQLQSALARSQKLEAVGTLASGVAHDFNNLLAAVLGFVEMARISLREDESADGFLEQAEEAIAQARDVTASLLTFARGSPVRSEPLVLNRLVAEHAQFLNKLLPASIDVVAKAPVQPLTVVADATQIRQVLTNLVINARDAMPEGGIVTVRLAADQGVVTLSVEDTGNGIAPEVQARVFEPFFTTKGHGQGTGLGLAVVHGVVEAHNGDVHLASQPGSGTIVTVRLPAADEPVLEAPPVSTHRRASAPWRVLLVEDNKLVREACRLRMNVLGLQVSAVADAEQALALQRSIDTPDTQFQIALLDVDLPGMNGVAAAQELRERQAQLPVVFFTGDPNNRVLDEVTGDPVLAKPLDFDELIETFETLLRGVAPG